jgi:hypothetical protein
MITPFKDDYMEETPCRFEEVFLLNKTLNVWPSCGCLNQWIMEVAQAHANFVARHL